MSVEIAYKEILKRLKREAKGGVKACAKKMRMPYNTLQTLTNGTSQGTIRTWLKVEKYFTKQDRVA